MSPLDPIRAAFQPVLAELVPDQTKLADYLGMIKPAANADHGDYQANVAMPLSKALGGKKPPEVAKEIIARLPANEFFDTPTVAGPGFINIRLKDSWIAQQVQSMAKDDRLGVSAATKPKKIVIDYSGPNVAKPLHVGHLRSTIIGDALIRLFRFLGHEVVGDNHLGDWGTQFGMLIYGYRTFLDKDGYKKNRVRELARLYVMVRNVSGTVDILANAYTNFRDEAAFAQDPVKELTRIYINGLKRSKSNEDDEEGEAKGAFVNLVADAYRAETAKLHEGDPENLKLWKEFMPACMEEIDAVYKKLDILPMDNVLGESFYHHMLSDVVADLEKKGVAEPGDGGSVIIRFGPDNVALVRKRDGAFTYTTTDLATIKYRIDTWKPDALLYVVDFRQAQHFKNLFNAAKRWGHEQIELQHLSFGSVLGNDGKPLKTRDGGAPELGDLLDMATELGGRQFELIYWQRAARGHDVPKWEEFSEEEKAQIARVIGIGAVKYADLSQNRTSDYKFDFNKMLATTGNTATYMQYAYARCRAIFRKGQVDDARFRTDPPAVMVTHAAERTICMQLIRFEDTLQMAASDYAPHVITGYLWDLAKAFSTFFENCPVLTAESPELRESRLLLVDLTSRVIRQALELLGIRTVERM